MEAAPLSRQRKWARAADLFTYANGMLIRNYKSIVCDVPGAGTFLEHLPVTRIRELTSRCWNRGTMVIYLDRQLTLHAVLKFS